MLMKRIFQGGGEDSSVWKFPDLLSARPQQWRWEKCDSWRCSGDCWMWLGAFRLTCSLWVMIYRSPTLTGITRPVWPAIEQNTNVQSYLYPWMVMPHPWKSPEHSLIFNHATSYRLHGYLYVSMNPVPPRFACKSLTICEDGEVEYFVSKEESACFRTREQIKARWNPNINSGVEPREVLMLVRI